MKLKRCFVDEHGNIWRDTTLIEASKNLPIKPFEIKSSLPDEIIRWKLSNVRDYMTHYKRVRNCDCSIPIILRSDGYPMDGWHRIIKALAENKKLTCRQFIQDPKPDFTNT
jgi:hypothetical protein